MLPWKCLQLRRGRIHLIDDAHFRPYWHLHARRLLSSPHGPGCSCGVVANTLSTMCNSVPTGTCTRSGWHFSERRDRRYRTPGQSIQNTGMESEARQPVTTPMQPSLTGASTGTFVVAHSRCSQRMASAALPLRAFGCARARARELQPLVHCQTKESAHFYSDVLAGGASHAVRAPMATIAGLHYAVHNAELLTPAYDVRGGCCQLPDA